MADNSAKTVIEALLFASEKPLSLEQVKGVLDTLDNTEVKRLIEELKSEYENNNRAMRIVEVAGGFQMVTSAGLVSFLNKLYKQRHADKLSKPALETLAIIAYKQPLTRSEIEALRNVNVDGVMKTLLDKNLIRIAGRKKAPGSPRVYGTTRQFLEHFGLKSLTDLPNPAGVALPLPFNPERVDLPKPFKEGPKEGAKIEELNTLKIKQELSADNPDDVQKAEEADGIKNPA